MPHEGNLYDFLAGIDLQQYHHDFVNKLGVTAVEHVAYVQSDDVLNLGMTAPEWRRLQASMKKARKGKLTTVKDKIKGGKQKPTIVRVNTKDGAPTGGHIIASTALQITDRELGRGEFGKVMQGIWTNDQGQKVQVAIKCLNPERFADQGGQDFLKEAAIMHSLNHEHLVKLYGVVLDMDPSLVLVTEFAPLRSLCENIKQPALRLSFPVNLLLDFTQQMADAMKYLHYSNIIHRDLATRNILLFVDDEGTKQIKISDFGLSRRLMIGENYQSEMRPNLKLPLAWMPVEALTKLTFTKASDVWSFGVTMWEMFSYGCQPWATKSGEEILRAIDRPNLQRLSKPEACPSQVYELILKCWRHEPESRPTFAEICEEIPRMKPLQVRAVANYRASREEELSYKSEDVITVLDANDDTGVWRGVTADGHIGLFHRSNTTLVSGSGGGKLKRWKSGSKGSNKAENRKRFGSPKTPKKSPSKLTTLDISTPSEYKHVFHVGYDGRVQGDPTFGGDYRSLPSGGSPSKSDQWSSASSNSSRSATSTPHRSPSTTPSKSPTFPSVSIQPRNHHMLSNEPPVTTSSQPDIRAGIPIAGPRVRLAEDETKDLWDLEGSSCSLVDDHSIEGASTSGMGATATSPDDELSSLDFGSLLDDVMTAWDATRTIVGIDNPQSTSETTSKEGANGAASGRSTPSSVGEDSHGASISASSQSQGITVMVGNHGNRADHGATLASSPEEGSLDSLPPLHNAITKDMPSNPVKTFRRTPSTQSAASASSVVSYQSNQSLPKDGRDAQWETREEDGVESRFTHLSSATSESADNEYVDDLYGDEAAGDSGQVALNGQASYGASAAVNGNGHVTHEDRADEILEAGDYTDLAAPDDTRYQDTAFAAEIDSTSASVSLSSRVSSQVSKTSTEDSDDDVDDRPSSRNNGQRNAVSSTGQEAYERSVGGSSVATKPRSPSSTKSPRKPKGPPPMAPPPKGPPRPKGPPPPVPPAPWKKQESPSPSHNQYANHAGRDADNDDTQYSVSALRQKFDFSRRSRDEPSSRRSSGESPTRLGIGRSGSYKESANVQASVGRSNSAGSYDSNKSDPEVKLSDRTIESLERVMPRRTRRSIGEGKHKRRSSDDVSESDRSSMASSRASEGDSSSDEGTSKPTTTYPSAACPLPDLPEDQTNHLSSSATHHPLPLPPRQPHHNAPPQRQAQTSYSTQLQRPLELKPRSVRQDEASHDGQYATPVIGVSDDLQSNARFQQRSQSFDGGIMSNMQTYPQTNPFRPKSHSIDILDTEGSHVTTSPEQIRELLNITNERADMPSRTPPPIPKRLSHMQRSKSEDANSMTFGLGNLRIHGGDGKQDYEFMKPQPIPRVNVQLFEQHQHDSDSGVDSPELGLQSSQSESDPNLASNGPLGYMRMRSPSAIRRDLELGEGKFTRSRSAHTIKWPRQSDQVSVSPEQHQWENVTTVARSTFKEDGQRPRGRRTLEKHSHKSRSVDDLLSAGGKLGDLKEAESLRDILARTYSPPKGGATTDQTGIYLVPRSWKSTLPSPCEEEPTTTNVTYTAAISIPVHPSAPPPPQPSPRLGGLPPPPSLQGHYVKDPNNPGYIDMSSPSPDSKHRPPFMPDTIPEDEVLPPQQTNDGYISCSLPSNTRGAYPLSTVQEMPILPSQGDELHSSPIAGISSSSGYYELSASTTRQKSRHSPSKELHVIPASNTQRVPNRTERAPSLTKSLSQEIPLPKRNRQSSEGADSEETSPYVEVDHGIEARRLKQQLPEQITLKACLEALRDARWNPDVAKKQLLIHHLAETIAVEECACEIALKQANWNLEEAVEILYAADELSVSL